MTDYKRFHVKQTDSTQNLALQLWSEHGDVNRRLLVVADEQSEGTGRQGRRWASQVGGLWMTLIFSPATDEPDTNATQKLPLIAGLAVAESLQSSFDLDARIKWPNDLLVDDSKIAGILCQHNHHPIAPTLRIGIGVNVNNPVRHMQGLRRSATSVRESLGVDHDLPIRPFEADLVERLITLIGAMDHRDMQPMIEAIDQRLAWRNQPITFSPGPQSASQDYSTIAILRGIDEQGQLCVEREDGSRQTMISGEVDLLSSYESQRITEHTTQSQELSQ